TDDCGINFGTFAPCYCTNSLSVQNVRTNFTASAQTVLKNRKRAAAVKEVEVTGNDRTCTEPFFKPIFAGSSLMPGQSAAITAARSNKREQWWKQTAGEISAPSDPRKAVLSDRNAAEPRRRRENIGTESCRSAISLPSCARFKKSHARNQAG
ncbi:MAG: hypothetical protein NC131_19430, partial [Roseburia sp.]|nr:hypothetical protein [Roseburia sp.]